MGDMNNEKKSLEQEPKSKPNRYRGSSYADVEQGRTDMRESVYSVAGNDISEVPSTGTALSDTVEGQHATENRERTHAWSELNRLLTDIENDAVELGQKNLEHRVPDLRDKLPIFANIRSHKLATKEGKVVERMQSSMAELASLVQRNELAIDVSALAKAVSTLKIPGGITKGIATVLPPLRHLHRSVTTTRAEEVRDAALDLRTMVQQRTNGGEMGRAA